MQSHLTRRVFRAILAGRSYTTDIQCSKGLSSSKWPRSRLVHSPMRPRHTRSLFGFSGSAFRRPGPPKSRSLDAGMDVLQNLVKSREQRSRPPTVAEIKQAINDFLSARLNAPAVLTGRHLQYLIEAVRTVNDAEGEELPLEDLQNALVVLDEADVERSALQKLYILTEKLFDTMAGRLREEDIERYVTLLSFSGNARTARHTLHEKKLYTPALWIKALKEIALLEKADEVQETLNAMEKVGIPLDSQGMEDVVEYLTENNNMHAVRLFYDKVARVGGLKPTDATKVAIVKCSIRCLSTDWADHIFRSLVTETPDAETWNLIFLWAGAQGKSVEELKRMVEVMRSKNIAPTTTLVNNLVEFAVQAGRLKQADDFLSLLPALGLEPDVRTRVLQIEYQIKADDVLAAYEIYTALDIEGYLEHIPEPLMNKLVAAMFSSKQVDPETLTELLEIVDDHGVRITSDTMGAICARLLQDNELEEIASIFETRSSIYSPTEREQIREYWLRYILDRKVHSRAAWHAYELLRRVFPETDVATRTELMNSFFERGKPSMAMQVFGHMRQFEEPSRRPNTETYAQAFCGLALNSDASNLRIVHNMLKLDIHVDPNTKVRNALMLAYDSTGKVGSSRQLYRSILVSAEGPTLSTFRIALKYCERAYVGKKEAVTIMEKAAEYFPEMPKALEDGYMAVLAAHSGEHIGDVSTYLKKFARSNNGNVDAVT